MPEFVSMLSPWQWAVVALVPPAIVALYFLKLRREPLEVPSTYLWAKSIEDLHVNSLWQRLRRSLLLLLQLLLIALLVLALFNPSWQGDRFSQDRFVFLVDNSASMTATDVGQEGLSRLDLAKRRVAEMIDSMDSRDVGMIISFSDTAEVVQESTQNHSLLRRRLESIRPTNRPTRMDDALRIAAGLANPGRYAADPDDAAAADARPAELVVFSDFRLPNVQNFSLGTLSPRFEMIGSPEEGNLGIVAFATRRLDERPQDVQAFARIGNFTGDPRQIHATLYVNGVLFDNKEIELLAGESQGVTFDVSELEVGVLRLAIDSDDALAVDDEAWVVVNTPRRSRVLLVTPGNVNLHRALSTTRAGELADVTVADPSFVVGEEYQQKARAGWYDLIIYDQCAPEEMPAANTLFNGQLPPDDRWSYGSDIEYPQIIDTERTHPLMQLLDLGNVAIYQAQELKIPLGGTTLIDSHEGPIFAIAPRGSYEDAVFGFDFVGTEANDKNLSNTNWSLRSSFPVFIHEVLTYLGGGRGETSTDNVRPGGAFVVRAISAPEELIVEHPGGERTRVPPGRENEFTITSTEQLGVYEVYEGDKLTRQFAVNLFDPNESAIEPQPGETVMIGHTEVEVQQTPEWEYVRREAWKPLVLLALAALVFEWYIYNRRVFL